MSPKPSATLRPHTPAHRPTTSSHPTRKGAGWMRRHKASMALAAGLLLLATTAMAALMVRQDLATSPSAITPDVVFDQGTGYASINDAGFATLTVGSSGSSANLALSGVPGAALVSMTNVMKITNQDDTQAYTVTLARSATPHAALSDFTVVVKNGGTTLATWNAATSASSSAFTLPASGSLDISIQTVIADGTAAGSLGSFGMQFSLAPV